MVAFSGTAADVTVTYTYELRCFYFVIFHDSSPTDVYASSVRFVVPLCVVVVCVRVVLVLVMVLLFMLLWLVLLCSLSYRYH